MEKILFDTHTHISDEAYEDRDALAASIIASPVKYCVDIGCSLKTSLDAIESAKRYDFCYAAVGIHPSEVEELDEDKLRHCMQAYENEPRVAAIGEIGLDYHYDDGPDKELQKYWFQKQLEYVLRYDAPVCIHSRDADLDTMNILKESGLFDADRWSKFPRLPGGGKDARVLIHCFGGSVELSREYTKLGACISLGGAVTFKNARRPAAAAQDVCIDNLLLETDCPYMSPEPKRGTRNSPVNVYYVAKKIAELRSMPYEDLAKITMKNACRFYNIKDEK